MFSMSDSSPIAIFQASWTISCAPTPITHSSAVAAITEAAEAAMPSTTATTLAGWRRSWLTIAIASHTSPPGELMCSRISVVSSGSSASATANSFADTPQ